ncbi:hypothetical protein ABC977_13950 [Thioalkalicoccus limnaeus]|uniref:Uncharacterized protein n=1 Tax=Thioalkalicoccus limnaeus TaxID=120681 RepID=A0ABV4BG42_9GAMM
MRARQMPISRIDRIESPQIGAAVGAPPDGRGAALRQRTVPADVGVNPGAVEIDAAELAELAELVFPSAPRLQDRIDLDIRP